ncbi:hypothetical protein [Streptomyces sp. CMSTAAHL-2]|uniref:hypothetical protein n=1 Tax=Streptomyces sp. CMSTAAHL-2 TaxID=2904522 RepID=UPI001E4959A1|nr:hypothetical protein [Streptomyces sp. CMSTAAHL-2]MCE3030679.1 hypothetical protein [Streptomyces sp. CMSTAAHL-2]
MTWADMDPATHPFDPGRALAVVREVVSSSDPATGRPRGLVSSHSVARGLAERYGPWAFGWYGNVDEDPCAGALIRKPLGDTADDLDAQVQNYTGILLEWRSWLEELAALFAESAPHDDADAGEEERRRSRERGVAPVVALVVERTDAGELWRAACARTLTWYLESTGMASEDAEDLADDVVDGEFESWVAPDAEAVGKARDIIGKHGA